MADKEESKRSSAWSMAPMFASILAAGVSGAFSLWVSGSANELKAESEKAQLSLTERSQQLQQQIHSDERELRIVQQVMEALRSSRENPAQLQAASALVYRLPSDVALRCQLAEILVDEERRTAVPTQMPSRFVVRLRTECVSEEVALAEGGAAASNIAAQQTDSVPAAPLPQIASRDLVAVPNPRGWDIDVFWCAGPGADENRARADRVGEALADAANANRVIAPGLQLGRVRVRELREDLNRRPGYSVYRDELRAEGSEQTEARQLTTFLAAETSTQIERRQSTTSTPWYISAFMCSSTPAPARGSSSPRTPD